MSWKGQQAWGAGQQQPWGKGAQQQSWGGGGKGAQGQFGGPIKPITPNMAAKPAGQMWGAAKPVGQVAQSWSPAGKGAAAAPAGPSQAQMAAKLTKNTTEIAAMEKVTNTTIESAKLAAEKESPTVQALKAAGESLEKQKAKLVEFEKTLTKDCQDSRKVGPVTSAQEFSKVLIKCKSLQQALNLQVGKLKPKMMLVEKQAANKQQEIKDNAAFKPLIAKMKAEVAGAETALSSLTRQITPMVAKPPEEGEVLDKKVETIEKGAIDGQKKIDEARTKLNELFKTIQPYSPEAKKACTATLIELQKKLADTGKLAITYKNFKKEFPKLVASQKAVTEVTDKLAGHEAPIAKAAKVAEAAKLTVAQVKTIDDALEPVLQAIKESRVTINAKKNGADVATQEKFTKLQTRSDELKKKVDAVNLKIKGQKDAIKAEEGIAAAKEKLEAVDTEWAKCADAEMPFLTGVEVLPDEVGVKALKECSDALNSTNKALSEARNWVNQKQQEAKHYEKELAASTAAELKLCSEQVHALETKVGKFRKETADRKVTAILVPAIDAAAAFETKFKPLDAKTKSLAADKLEDQAEAAITALVDDSKKALEEARTSMEAAKKIINEKQREAHAQQNNEMMKQISENLNAGQEKLNKLRNAVSSAERLVKVKAAVVSGEEKMKEAEAAVSAAQKAAPAEGKKISMDKITALDEACANASKLARVAASAVQPHLGAAAPKAKEALQALLERKTTALAAVEKVKADTRERREATLSDHYLADAEALTKAAEAAATKMEQAEGPFLIGTTHDLKATQALLAKCKEAGDEVQTAMAAASKAHNTRKNDVRSFEAAAAKTVNEALTAMGDRVKKVQTKLNTFNKDNDERTKDSKMVEAGESTDELEADGKKTLELIAPFEKEGADDMSEADAAAPLKAYKDAEKETTKKVSALRSSLAAREREQKGNKENTEALKKLKERLEEVNKGIVDKRKVCAPHETKAMGTRLLAELKEQVGGLDAELKKATEACAPLLAGGIEFLTGNSIKTLVRALRAHMKVKELDVAALFKEAGGKKMGEKAFVKYLAGLADSIDHDELSAFSDERRVEIFKKLAADSKSLTEADFKAMFNQKMVCVKAVVVTDKATIEGSETVAKVEPNTELDVFGATQQGEDGLVRSECTVDGKNGWVSIRQDKGATFLTGTNPFKTFCANMDKCVATAQGAVAKARVSLQQKSKQGGEAKDGSRLKEAREEMNKLAEPIAKAEKDMQEMRTKVGKARGEFATKERLEQNAHIDARNAKEAAPFVDGPKGKMEALEADAKAAEEAGEAMKSLVGEELAAFATPASTLENVEKFQAAVQEKAKELREAIKEQQTAVAAVTPQTPGTADAKRQLQAMGGKAAECQQRSQKIVNLCKNKCKTLVDAKVNPVSEGIRKHAAAKKVSPQDLFDSLKKGDKIPEAAYCKLLESLEGLSISAEIAKLLARKLEADGISQDAFLKYVVIYYKVAKTIAFTDAQDITACKTLRKGEEGEVIEVLEGPVTDEANGMTRIRGRSTKEDAVEGWVTLSGSKGTAFLEKCAKPIAKKA